jgi:TRAP-type uncharacterized transport system fused permease subunit
MMKRLGYRPEFAGAVEAAASTGGQIMPPVMGAAAFLMAEFIGMPYIEIAKAAAIPACLYFLGVLLEVHFEAKRCGLRGLSGEIPRISHVMKTRHLFIPHRHYLRSHEAPPLLSLPWWVLGYPLWLGCSQKPV